MSGCIYSHFESQRSGCFDMYNMMEVNATHEGVVGGGGGAWTSATKQDVVWINIIIIESLCVNEWLWAAFMLSKRKEGLSSHESFLSYTIFSWQVSSSFLNKRQECHPPPSLPLPPAYPGWLLLRWLCVNAKQTHVQFGCWSYCMYIYPVRSRRVVTHLGR